MKRLEKLRDELAESLETKPNQFSRYDCVQAGFDAATKELMQVIDIQREAIYRFGFGTHPSGVFLEDEVAESYALKIQKEVDAILNGESNALK